MQSSGLPQHCRFLSDTRQFAAPHWSISQARRMTTAHYRDRPIATARIHLYIRFQLVYSLAKREDLEAFPALIASISANGLSTPVPFLSFRQYASQIYIGYPISCIIPRETPVLLVHFFHSCENTIRSRVLLISCTSTVGSFAEHGGFHLDCSV